MNPSSLYSPRSSRLSSPLSRLLVTALSGLAICNACSSDAAAPAAPITFGIEVTSLDGHGVDEDVLLRCDHGGPGDSAAAVAFSTLAVTVALSPTEAARKFVLRPANACGASKRCGFVRIEALNAAADVLAQTDTVTTEGVLKLDLEQLPDLKQVRVSLILGVDQKPLQNPDKAEVNSVVTPTFVVPTDCVAPPSGGAGGDSSAGGAGGDNSAGGAGGGASQGGDSSTPALGGAGGDSSTLGGIGGA
jgi:hypothetical protein